MKVIVCGGRTYSDLEYTFQVLDLCLKWWKLNTIITGGTKGADALAHEWAIKRKLKTEIYPADWDTYGKDGPRSGEMIYNKLVTIENSRSARNKLDKIDEIIGNKSWTHNHCSSCSTQTRDPLVSIDVSGGEYSCQLCITCVKKMLDLLERAK